MKRKAKQQAADAAQANLGGRMRSIPLKRPLDVDIQRRAYELYSSRGRESGHAIDDWLRAEREILGV
jgi:hypothetical protein